MAVNKIAALEKNLWAQWSLFGAPAGCSYQRDDEICQLDTPVPSFSYNGVFKFCARALTDSCGKDVDLLALHSTPMAHGLYRRFGFRDIAPYRLFTPADASD